MAVETPCRATAPPVAMGARLFHSAASGPTAFADRNLRSDQRPRCQGCLTDVIGRATRYPGHPSPPATRLPTPRTSCRSAGRRRSAWGTEADLAADSRASPSGTRAWCIGQDHPREAARREPPASGTWSRLPRGSDAGRSLTSATPNVVRSCEVVLAAVAAHLRGGRSRTGSVVTVNCTVAHWLPLMSMGCRQCESRCEPARRSFRAAVERGARDDRGADARGQQRAACE
jgi:hypothetical protein